MQWWLLSKQLLSLSQVPHQYLSIRLVLFQPLYQWELGEVFFWQCGHTFALVSISSKQWGHSRFAIIFSFIWARGVSYRKLHRNTLQCGCLFYFKGTTPHLVFTDWNFGWVFGFPLWFPVSAIIWLYLITIE